MKLGVIGGGAWGTALAQVASANDRETLLWVLEPEVVEAVNVRHENSVFLPGVPLNETIRATCELDALRSCDAWLVVTPAQHMRSVLERVSDWDRPIVLCSKGIEERSGNIAPDRRAEEGRALAFGNDPGWSEVLAPLFSGPDAPPDDELLRGVAAALKAWPWGQRPTWMQPPQPQLLSPAWAGLPRRPMPITAAVVTTMANFFTIFMSVSVGLMNSCVGSPVVGARAAQCPSWRGSRTVRGWLK